MLEITIQEKTLLNKLSLTAFYSYCFLGVLINSTYADIPVFRRIINIFRVACFLFLIADAVVNYFSIPTKVNILSLLCLLVGGMNFVACHNYKLLLLALFLCWSKYYPLKELMNKAKTIYFIAIVFIIASSLLGIIPMYTNQRYNSSSIRYALGFIAPTLLPAYFMFALLMDCYVHNFCFGKVKIVAYFLSLFVVYVLTDTRFDCMIAFGVLLLATFISLLKKSGYSIKKLFFNDDSSHFYYKIISFLPVLCFAIGVLLVVGYQQGISLFRTIADHLSGRIQYTIQALSNHSFTLFGESIVWSDEGIILDSSYFKCLFEQGYIGFLFVMVYYFLTLEKCLKNHDKYLFLILSIILIESIFEPFLYDYNYNLFTLFFVNVSYTISFSATDETNGFYDLYAFKLNGTNVCLCQENK